MSKAGVPFSLPEDDFDDEAIRRELLRIVQDSERRIQSDFEAKKAEIAAEAALLDDCAGEAAAIVLARLDAASSRMPHYFQKMREFIERQ